MIKLDYNKNTRKLQIKCDDNNLFSSLRDYFSVEDKNAKFRQRSFGVRNFRLPTRKYIITPTGICDVGLYWEIKKFLIHKQIIKDVIVTDALRERLDKNFLNKPVFSEFNLNLRDYQIETIERSLAFGCGVCVLGTGAGKTFITASLIENLYRLLGSKSTFKCLLIVPDLGLVKQTYEEFKRINISFKFAMWTGSNSIESNEHNVIICNSQILTSQIDKSEWVKFVDLLIVDECHKVKPGNEISKIITSIKTPYKYGFTGTLPQEEYDRWFIIGKLGPVIFQKTSSDLREEKFLTNVSVKILKLNYSNTDISPIGNRYRNELNFIYNSVNRNNIISKLCQKMQNNTLVLVNHIEHGEIIKQALDSINIEKKIFFIQGSVDVEERERIKALMENNNNIICIAISAIFSTGVNIKNLHNIIFIAGGKSFIRTVQSIGRGLRLHEAKEKLQIIDICDNLTYSTKHCEQRKLIYKQEKIDFTERLIDIT